jgi:glycosyltransferase involved in cell wall biosynthesis
VSQTFHTNFVADKVHRIDREIVKEVAPYLNLFDLNLNCSRGTETSCLAISEAMSLGIPTLASDYGGNPELVREGYNGLLFKTDDEGALLAGILRFYRDENLQKSLRAGAEKLSKQSFSAENMAKMYTKLYKSMLSTEKG